jgi:hypothetical protein
MYVGIVVAGISLWCLGLMATAGNQQTQVQLRNHHTH